MLSYKQKFKFAWELIWPGMLIDVGWGVLTWVLGFTSTGLDSVYHVAAFFVIMPWVVRRAIRYEYSGFRFAVVADGDDEPHPMTYQESLKVMWLLEWRGSVLLLLSLVPVSFLLGKVLHLPLTEWFEFAKGSQLANNLGLTAVDVVTGFTFFPLLTPGMLKKQYHGFRVHVKPAAGPTVWKKL